MEGGKYDSGKLQSCKEQIREVRDAVLSEGISKNEIAIKELDGIEDKLDKIERHLDKILEKIQ